MRLQSAVVGSRLQGQQPVWVHPDGTEPDLSSATITGKKQAADGTITDITGTLVPNVLVPNTFDWTYSVADVAVEGSYSVQFTATYLGGAVDRTPLTLWVVNPAL